MTHDILPLSCHLPAIGTQYFPLTDHFVFGSYQRESLVGVTSTTHFSSGPLGTVSLKKCLTPLKEWCLTRIEATILVFVLLLSNAHTHSHTFAFILQEHQPHQIRSKPLQIHFWSLC